MDEEKLKRYREMVSTNGVLNGVSAVELLDELIRLSTLPARIRELEADLQSIADHVPTDFFSDRKLPFRVERLAEERRRCILVNNQLESDQSARELRIGEEVRDEARNLLRSLDSTPLTRACAADHLYSLDIPTIIKSVK